MAQVVAAHGEPKLRSRRAAEALRVKCDVSQTDYQQRRTVADLDSATFTFDVALVRALGGGFADKP